MTKFAVVTAQFSVLLFTNISIYIWGSRRWRFPQRLHMHKVLTILCIILDFSRYYYIVYSQCSVFILITPVLLGCKMQYDTGWAWIVMLGAFYEIFLLNSWIANYGQFFVEIQTITNSTATQVAWIATINYVTLAFLSPLTDYLCRRFTHRIVIMSGCGIITICRMVAMFVTSLEVFIIVLGFLDGIGEACIFAPSMAFLCYYFKRRLGFATAITLAGCSVAILVSCRATAIALQELGLHQTLLIHSALSAQGIVAGALFFPRRFPKQLTTNRRTTASWKDFLPNDGVKILLILAYCFGCITTISGSKYLAPHAKDLGIDTLRTSWMLSLAGIPDIAAKLITGFLCDISFVKHCIQSYRIFAISSGVLSLTCFLMTRLENYIGIFINFMAMFFAIGVFNICSVIATSDLVGSAESGSTFSSMLWGASIFLLMDIFVIAGFRDWTGTYNWSYYTLAIFAILSSILLFLIQVALKRRKVGLVVITDEMQTRAPEIINESNSLNQDL